MKKNIATEKEIFGHPVGLFMLFFTEMWERFSYYGMRALLVLYLISEISSDNPGLGWSQSNASELYGWYTMFVYITPIFGGIIADKIIGFRKANKFDSNTKVLISSLIKFEIISGIANELGNRIFSIMIFDILERNEFFFMRIFKKFYNIFPFPQS